MARNRKARPEERWNPDARRYFALDIGRKTIALGMINQHGQLGSVASVREWPIQGNEWLLEEFYQARKFLD